MGNVSMEARDIIYRGGETKMSVEEALKSTSGEAAAIAALQEAVGNLQTDTGNLQTTKANLITIAPVFSAEVAYDPGDLVYYNGLTYRCVNAHEGEWDADDFAATTISGELDELKSGLTNLIKSNTVTLTSGINGHAETSIADTVKVLHVTSNGAPCLAFTYNGHWFFSVLTWDASTLQLALKPSAETTFTYYYV